ncbi:hypothetical protein L195_g042390 [Trifolium pratense]|uniref:Uncharacterized protein n=1 Tax=Trifolium pratense TaxID=57577 RepID=A0A2K3M690_TRIPR|nr:hypothetical protein L195_g042390 [Trifolium pratense]
MNRTPPFHTTFKPPNWGRESSGFLNRCRWRSFSLPLLSVIHDLCLGQLDLRWSFRPHVFCWVGTAGSMFSSVGSRWSFRYDAGLNKSGDGFLKR